MQNKIIQSSGLILFFTAITYILNYAYTLIAIHFLTPLEYSELAFLIAVYSLFGIFGATITNISLPLLHEKENTQIKLEVIAVTKFLSIVLLFLSITIFPLIISKFFNIENFANIILFSVGGVLTLANALLVVHLQVVKDFFKVGLIQVFSTFIKFSFSLVLLYFGYNIFGVGIALLLSTILAILFFFPYTRENIKILKEQISSANFLKKNLPPLRLKNEFRTLEHVKNFWYAHKDFILKSFFGSLVLTLLITLDTILAKKFLHSDIVGFFVGISTLAKLYLFGIIAISSVIFPYYLSEKEESKKKNILNYFLIFILATSALFISVSYFFHNFFVTLILGVKYSAYSYYLFYISLFVSFASLSYFLTQLHILENNKNFLKNLIIFFIFSITIIFIFLKLFQNTPQNFSYLLSIMFAFLSFLLYNFDTNKK
jgi:O-antigen/teichoic acid export membrane protein